MEEKNALACCLCALPHCSSVGFTSDHNLLGLYVVKYCLSVVEDNKK